MADKSKKPAIRFAGFTDAWEQRKFEDIAVRSSSMSTESGLPRVEYEDIISGTGRLNKDIFAKESEKEGIVFHKGDVLYGKLRPYLQNWLLPSFNGLAVGDFWVLQPQNADSSFLYRLIQSRQFDEVANQSTGTKMPRADWKLVSKTEFYVPHSLNEQSAIGAYFTNLDDLITLHQRKYDKLQNVKKSMLEKMFPKNGRNIPEIRFAGFTDAWEQRKFSEIVTPYADPIPTPTDGYFRLGIRSHAKGTFHSYVRAGMELETAQMHRVAADKFIVNITFGWEHAVAITDENDAGKLVSHRFPQFSFNTGMVPSYFKFAITDENFRHHLWLASPGGAGRNRVLKIDEMLEYKFWVTSADEQLRIAQFLERLDNLITLHQRKYDKLQNVKKSMLEKMFPKNGSNIPEIRFAGFTDAWEQRKLGELVDRVVRKNINLESTLPLTISAQYGLVDQITYFNNRVASHDVSNYYLVLNGEFAYNKSTSDGFPFGAVKRLDLYEKGVLSTLYIVFSIKDVKVTNSDFLTVFFDTDRWHKGVSERAAEGARNHGLLNISADDFFDIDLYLPLQEGEQKQIGAYFKQLDDLITLHQRELEKLKNLKKACLEKMFV